MEWRESMVVMIQIVSQHVGIQTLNPEWDCVQIGIAQS